MKNISEKLRHEGYRFLVSRSYEGREEIIGYGSDFASAEEYVRKDEKKHIKSSYAIHELAGGYWIFN